jgi:hypothetical protein
MDYDVLHLDRLSSKTMQGINLFDKHTISFTLNPANQRPLL